MPVKTGSISAAQLKALRDTPQKIINDPAAGYAVIVDGVQYRRDAGTAYTVAQDNLIEVRYSNGSGHLFCSLTCVGCLDQATDQHRYVPANNNELTPVESAPVVAKMAGAAEITQGSGPLKYRVFFRRLKLGF